MKNPANVKLTASEKAVFDLSFAYDCISAKVLADADTETAPTKKNGAHPVHLKGREKSLANKRFGAAAKKDRKVRCGSRQQEWFDACSYKSGKEFSAMKRSILIEEEDRDYDLDTFLFEERILTVDDLNRTIDQYVQDEQDSYEELREFKNLLEEKAEGLASFVRDIKEDNGVDEYTALAAFINVKNDVYQTLVENSKEEFFAILEKAKYACERWNYLMENYKFIKNYIISH